MRSLKTGISAGLVTLGIIYSAGCFVFYQKANALLDNIMTNELVCTKVNRAQFSVNPFFFQINLLDDDLKEKKASVTFNPISNSIHTNVFQKVNATFDIPFIGSIDLDYTPLKGTDFLALKMNTSFFGMDFKKTPLQMFLDDDITLGDFYAKDLKQKVELKANYTNEHISKILPKHLVFEVDIHDIQFMIRNGVLETSYDYSFKALVNNSYTKEGSHKEFIALSLSALQNIAKILLKQENKENLQDIDKDACLSYLHHFIKTLKINLSVDEKTFLDNDKIQLIAESNGGMLIDGTQSNKITFDAENNVIKTSLQKMLTLFKLTETIPPEFNINIDDIEKIINNFSDFLLKFDLKMSLIGKDNNSLIENAEIFKKSINDLKPEGEYDLSYLLTLAIDDNFTIKASMNGHFKEDFSAIIKIFMPKKSYGSLIQFAEKINCNAKDTSLEETINGAVLILKSIPYDQFFKCEKDPTSDEEVETFTFPIGNS